MALTPNSGLSSWIAPQAFFTFCDWRPVAQLLKDDGISSDYVSMTQALGNPPNPAYAALNTFLQAACGRVETALLRGNRYQASDLANLPAGSNAAAFLARLLAKVVQQDIFERRPAYLKNYEAINKEVNETLKALADGENIFPFLETQQAGLIEVERDTPFDVEERHLTSVIARRVMGTRGNQLRPWW